MGDGWSGGTVVDSVDVGTDSEEKHSNLFFDHYVQAWENLGNVAVSVVFV